MMHDPLSPEDCMRLAYGIMNESQRKGFEQKRQQGDLALLDNQLQSLRWSLTTLRADPACPCWSPRTR